LSCLLSNQVIFSCLLVGQRQGGRYLILREFLIELTLTNYHLLFGWFSEYYKDFPVRSILLYHMNALQASRDFTGNSLLDIVVGRLTLANWRVKPVLIPAKIMTEYPYAYRLWDYLLKENLVAINKTGAAFFGAIYAHG